MVVVSLRKGLFLLTPAALVAVAACSSTPPPAAVGNCVPVDDAACTVSGSVGGGSSGESDGGQSSGTTPTSCQVSSADSLCMQCYLPACCSLITACEASADCVALSTCVNDCLSASSVVTIDKCIGACTMSDTDPESVAAYNNLLACEGAKCANACDQHGVGNPCVTGYPSCVAGTTCNGSWCTKVCARDTDCAGTGGSGGDQEGTANVCVFVTGTGNTCAPSAPANCTATYADTFLDTAAIDVSGSPVAVCALITDGG